MIVRTTFLGLLLGCAVTIFLMQHDAIIKERVGKAFKNVFETSIECHMRCAVESVNVWQPALVLHDVKVTSADAHDQWWWTAQRLIISCTWWHLFCYGIIDVRVVLEKADIYSSVTDGVLAIQGHLNKLLFGSSSTIPLFTKSVIYKQSHIHITDSTNSIDVQGTWNSESKSIDNHFKTTLYCINGSLTCNGISYLSDAHGTMYLDMIYSGKHVDYDLTIDGVGIVLPAISPTMSTFTALWKYNQGTLHVVSDDRLFTLEATGAPCKADLSGTIPLSYLAHAATGNLHADVAGVCIVDVHSTKTEQWNTEGTWRVNNGYYGSIALGDGVGTVHTAVDGWHGSLTWHASSHTDIEGTWLWNQQQARLHLAVHEDQPLSLMHCWRIKSGTTTCTCTYDDRGITSSYATSFVDEYEEAEIRLEGNASYKAGTLSLAGTINERSYIGSCSSNDTGYHGSLTYDDDQRTLATITVNDATISGLVDLLCIKELLAACDMGQLQGEGTLQWTIPDYQHLPLTISCALDQTTIRIPQTYNAINNARGSIEWDYLARKIRLHDIQCLLYQGSVHCNQATLVYDDAWRLQFAHIPCMVHTCLLNMHKDVFALVSGYVTYTHKKDDALVSGLLTLDNSQLKENIFSDVWIQHFFTSTGMMFPISSNAIGCDLTIKTVTPTHIKTSFLDTTATVDLHVANTFAAPEVAGTITLGSGTLSFPYKPLYITQGSLYFVPGHLYDPVVEFSAKNSIKNHAIAMHVTGSLTKPHVALESWPPLTQEQTISLLLVGSYQDSLNIVMPALLMNNITALIFGDKQISHTPSHRFAGVLDPLKRIRFVPSFTDQTGRGGLRGAIEIDVSDRVHAVIQKNFSLTEDTYFELGYLLSDEINVRLLRDERRDMGAEVEMRWKFGS